MTIPQFQRKILSWYKHNRGDPRTRASSVRGRLPWRKTRDPYKILVSEVMLQQTQISRVLPKYKEFLKEFPTISILARARIKKLLKVWAGLGYWRRALFLRETVRKILKDFKGKFPQDPKFLETLPGIGPYTARALVCFAFGSSEAFLDTNIRRIYLHFFFPKRRNVPDSEILSIAQKAVDRICSKKRFAFGSFLEQTLGLQYSPLEDSGRANPPKVKQFTFGPREWHYALMDYGAMVLKDKKINRRSKHYHKQSKFEGSFRSFRTKVMRFLLDQQNQTATKTRIKRLLKEAQSPYAPEKILAALQKDTLIKKKRNSYSL